MIRGSSIVSLAVLAFIAAMVETSPAVAGGASEGPGVLSRPSVQPAQIVSPSGGYKYTQKQRLYLMDAFQWASMSAIYAEEDIQVLDKAIALAEFSQKVNELAAKMLLGKSMTGLGEALGSTSAQVQVLRIGKVISQVKNGLVLGIEAAKLANDLGQ